MAATVALHETVAEPEPVKLLGAMDPQDSPAGTVSVRLTVPLKVPAAETVIVMVADFPTVTEGGGIAVTLKSLGFTVHVALTE